MNKDIKEIKWAGQILDYVDTKEHLVELFNYITNLQEENERLTNARYSLDRVILEDRIDKAIEYINKYEYQRYCPSPYEKEKYIMREEKEGKELLDILRGKDE